MYIMIKAIAAQIMYSARLSGSATTYREAYWCVIARDIFQAMVLTQKVFITISYGGIPEWKQVLPWSMCTNPSQQETKNN